MIQFNLLPDVKLEFVKANRLKHTVTVVAIIAASAALGFFIILFLTVDVIQRAHMNNLNSQINSITSSLKSTPNLNNVLTVQGQVNALPGLHSTKPVTTRLPGFISELTPSNATISVLNVNFTANTISITGSANSLATVNQFVNTLKLSSYQTSSNSISKNAFSNVVLSSFAYTTASGASYTISASFDPNIFSSSYSTVTLNVPGSSSARTNNSSALFQTQTNTTGSSGN